MIGSHHSVHGGAGHDLAIENERPLGDRAEPDDHGFGWPNKRCSLLATQSAKVGDRDGAATEVFPGQDTLAGAPHQLGQCQTECREVKPISGL